TSQQAPEGTIPLSQIEYKTKLACLDDKHRLSEKESIREQKEPIQQELLYELKIIDKSVKRKKSPRYVQFSSSSRDGNTQSKLKVPGQKRRKNGRVDGTINLSTQFSLIKLIAGGSDFNFGSNMDIDMKQKMERLESSQLRFQIEYGFLEELRNFLSMD
ncbi:MAG: hypothetical protein EZS28_025334, partial [Streblomastix strix]